MGQKVQVSGGVNDLGYHLVWCPKYRRPTLAGRVKDRCEALRAEFPRLRSRLPTLWSRSYFATVGASAATAQRYIETQYGRPWRKGKIR